MLLSPVLDLPSVHGLVVKLKALEMDDQGVWELLYTHALHSINLQSQGTVLQLLIFKHAHITDRSLNVFTGPQKLI